jgi:hypothetical protein
MYSLNYRIPKPIRQVSGDLGSPKHKIEKRIEK